MRLNLTVYTGTLLAIFGRLRRIPAGPGHRRILLTVLLLASAVAPAHGSNIPTNLVATLGAGGVSLSWSAPTGNASTVTGYQVLRRHLGTDAAGVFNEIGTTGARQTTYTDASVVGGASYVYRVKARRGDKLSGFSNFTRIEVPPEPSKPSGLRAAAGHQSVTLSWNNPNNGTITGYEYRYRTGGAWSEWTAIDPSDSKTTSHRVTGLVNGQSYTFEVRAQNPAGPGTSASVSMRPIGFAPTNLTVAIVAGSVTLSWGVPAADAEFVTGYQVLRRRPEVDGAGVFHAIATTGGSETTYVDGGVEGGEKYAYRVKALRGTDLSLWTKPVNIVAPSVPSAPGNLSAAVGDGSVTLSWDDPDDDEITGYQVRYTTTGTRLPEWNNVPGSDANTTSHTVNRLTNCTEYTFEVRARAGDITGASSSVTRKPGAAPSQVTGVSVTGRGDGTVSLSWNGLNDATVTGYRITYSGATSGTIDVAGRTTTTHDVTGLTNCSEYTFEVSATNSCGVGPSSSSVTGTPGVAPSQVTGVSVTDTGDGTVSLSWDGSADATVTGYKITYSGATSGTIDVAGGATTSHRVTDLTNCSEYTFEVLAVNCVGGGSPSSSVTGTPSAAPYRAKRVSVTGTGDGTVSLRWELSADATVTGYRITYSGATSGTIDLAGRTTKWHDVTGLTNCSEYTFKVLTVNCKGYGEPSVGVTGTPGVAPAQVTGVSVTGTGDGTVSLSWDGSADATVTGYKITYSGATSGTIDVAGGATTSHRVTDLTNCSEYTFEVLAVNCVGGGSPSSSVTGTPSAAPYRAKRVSVTGTGDGTVSLRWELSADATVTGYRITYSGATSGTIDLAGRTTKWHDVTGLTNCSEYTFKVLTVNCKGYGEPSVGVTGTPGVAPAQVTGVSVTGTGDGTVSLSWDSSDDAMVTGYEITYSGATSGTIDVAGRTTTTQDVTGLTNCSEYTFEVSARNSCDAGPSSSSVTGTPGVAPSQVTGVSVTGTGDGTVTLSWDSSDDASVTGYQILYSGATSDTIDVGSDATSHAVAGLTNCEDYTFEVLAINCKADGAPSSSVTGTPGAAPAQVTGVTVTGTADGTVSLSWDSSDDATVTGYKISYSGAASGTIVVAGGATTTQDVTGLTNCEEYTFEVLAVNCMGDGAASSSVTARLGNAPGAVTGLSGSEGDDGEVTLSWTNPSGATKNEIRYAPKGTTLPTTWTEIDAATSYEVTGLTNCTEYTFEVRAKNGCGNGGAASDDARPGSAPGAVTGLSGSEGDDGQVTLSWTNPSGATKNEIRYAPKGTTLPTTWTEIDAATSYEVTGLTNCTEYTFEVRAKNGCGNGGAASDDARPGSAPGAVTGLSGSEGDDGQVTLSWTNPSGTITNNQIRYAKAGTSLPSTWTSIGVKTSHTVEDLDNCDEYTFEVRAVNCDGNGGADSGDATPSSGSAPGSVTGLEATKGNGQVTLSWTNPSGTITNNQIRYAKAGTSLPSTWTSIGVKTSHTVEDLDNCDEYTFEVRAVNCDGNGGADSGDATPSSGSAPGSVTDLEATKGNGQVTLSWANPSGTITNNQIRYAKAGTSLPSTWTSIGVKTSHTVEDLDNCDEYTFEVRAVNCDGNGGADSGDATPSSGSAPGAVTGLSGSEGDDGQVTLSWTNPSGTITNNQIRFAKAGTSLPSTWTSIGVKTSHTVEDLDNCDEYTFEVRAVNCDGNGGADSDKATPSSGSPPGAVTNLTATAGNTQVELSWTNPSGTITHVHFRYAPKGTTRWSSWARTDAATRHTVTGLTNCTEYTFEVCAVNCDGPGAADSDDARPGSAPGAVTGLSATKGNGQVALSWTNPSGATKNVIRYAPKGTDDWSSTEFDAATNRTVGELANCTEYTFEVRAKNGCGTGGADSENATPVGVPGEVDDLKAAKGDEQVTLSWSAPSGSCGITGYEISVGDRTLTTTGTSITVDELTNCTEYTFSVLAKTMISSGASKSVTQTPVPVPGQVTNLSKAENDGKVTLSWGAPSGSCGITGYEISNGDNTYTTTGTSFFVSGLTNCTEYTFSVLAKTMISRGASKSVTATPGVRPSKVTGASVTSVGDGSVTLGWDQHSDATVRSYRISYLVGLMVDSSIANGRTTTSYRVTGLSNCVQHNFQVHARNCKGLGGGSDALSGTPGVKPAAPTGLQVTSEGDGSVSLSWTQHSDTTVRGYRIIYGTSGASSDTVTVTGRGTTSRSVSGLTNCSLYTFKALAYNCKGDGTSSGGVTATPHAPISVSSISNRVGTKGKAVSGFRVGVSGGCPPYTYSLSSDPSSGSNLSISSGRISGTPTATGSFTIDVEVEDGLDNSGSSSFTFTVADPVVIASISDKTESVSVPFSEQVSVSGGRTAYSYSVSVTPTLPQGSTLTISNSGLIEGEITGADTYSVTVTVSDADSRTDTEEFDVTVGLPGDFNGNGRRDAADAEMLNKKSGLRSSDAGYDRRMDLNGDGVINFADLVILSGYIQKDASSQSDSESNDESE